MRPICHDIWHISSLVIVITIHKTNTLLYNIPVCKQRSRVRLVSLYIEKPIFEPRSLQISDFCFILLNFGFISHIYWSILVLVGMLSLYIIILTRGLKSRPKIKRLKYAAILLKLKLFELFWNFFAWKQFRRMYT